MKNGNPYCFHLNKITFPVSGMFCVVLLFFLSTGVFGQDLLQKLDYDMFDKYLEQASSAESREEWEQLALFGEELVMAKWESECLSLIDAGMNIDTLRDEARSELQGRLEERLTKWLLDRFFKEIGTMDTSEVLSQAKNLKIDSIFSHDDDGKLIYDSKGAPVRKDLPGDDAFHQELDEWKESLHTVRDQLIESWETGFARIFDELLANADPERRELLEASGQVRLSSLRQSQLRQMDRMIQLEESNYRFLRLRDQYSLRLKSEGSSAAETTEDLIRATRERIQDGLANLVAGLNTEAGEVLYEGRLVDGDEWQEQFRAELIKGLDLWNEAEEEFFARRISWEKQAGKDLAQGMEDWNKALVTIQEKKREWLNDFKKIEDQAETVFERKFLELQQAREQALAELDANIMANMGSLAERVETNIGMLSQSLGMMNTARDSMGYWLSKTSNDPDYSFDRVGWDITDMREEFAALISTEYLGTIGSDIKLDESSFDNFLPNTDNLYKRSLFFKRFLGNSLLRDIILPGFNEIFTDQRISEAIFNQMRNGDDPEYDGDTPGNTLDSLRTRISDELSGWVGREQTVAWADEFLSQYYVDENGENVSDYPDTSMEILAGLLQDSILGSINNKINVMFDSVNVEQSLYWLENIYITYSERAISLNREITGTTGLIVFGENTVLEEGYADNSTLMGPIEALNAYGWEEIYLDDYQVELLKARAVQAYWEKELEVAQAVYEYALDGTYTRQTEATTEDQFNVTYDNYETALAAYTRAVEALEEINMALSDNKTGLAEIRAELDEAKNRLIEEKEKYAQYLVMKELESTDYYTGLFRRNYERLLELRGLLPDSGDGLTESASLELADANARYEAETLFIMTSEALSDIINGNLRTDPPVKGIRELKNSLALLSGFDPDEVDYDDRAAFLQSVTNLPGVSEGTYWYAVLEDSYLEYEADGDRTRLEMVLAALRTQLHAETTGTMEKRMMAMRLLLSENEADAYSSISGIVTDASADSIETACRELEDSFEAAKTALLKKRLDIEIAALETLGSSLEAYMDTNNGDPSGFSVLVPDDYAETNSLAWIYLSILKNREGGMDGVLSVIQSELVSLGSLSEALAGVNGSLASESDLLKSLALENSVIYSYLKGGTLFSDGYMDYTLAFLSNEYTSLVATGGAASEYRQYSIYSPGLQNTLRTDAVGHIADWLEAGGLGSVSEDRLVLMSPEQVWDTFSHETFIEALSQILYLDEGFEELMSNSEIPQSIKSGLSNWFSGLKSFMLVKCEAMFGAAAVSSDTRDSRKQEVETADNDLTAFSDRIEYILDMAQDKAVRAFMLLDMLDSINEESSVYREKAVTLLGVSLAQYVSGNTPSDAYDGWCTSIGANVPQELKEKFHGAITAAAEKALVLAGISADPEGFVFANTSDKEQYERDVVREILKRMPLEIYLDSLESSGLQHQATAIYNVKEYLSEQDGESSFNSFAACADIAFGGDVDALNSFLEGTDDEEPENMMAGYTWAFLERLNATGLEEEGTFTIEMALGSIDSCANDAFEINPFIEIANGSTPAGHVYKSMLHASLYTMLTEDITEERDSVLALFTEITGISHSPELDLDSFSAADNPDERAMAGYHLDENALMFALTRNIISGIATEDYSSIPGEENAHEISELQSIVNTVNNYVDIFDGDFLAYLESEGVSLSAEAHLKALSYYNSGLFNDPAFYPAGGNISTALGFQMQICLSELNTVSLELTPAMYRQLSFLGEDIERAQREYKTLDHYLEKIVKGQEGEYRSYLGQDEYLLDKAAGQNWDDEKPAYDRSEETMDVKAEEEGSLLYNSGEMVINKGLEYASRLLALSNNLGNHFNSWMNIDMYEYGEDFFDSHAQLDGYDYTGTDNLPDEYIIRTMDFDVFNAYTEALSSYNSLMSEDYALTSQMNTNGKAIKSFFESMEDETADATLANYLATIGELETEVALIEGRWDECINKQMENAGPGNYTDAGYRQLEQIYSGLYESARSAYETLTQTRQEHRIAKAVYEYASTPYLKVEEDLSDVTDKMLENSLEAIQNVDPDTRLKEVKDNMSRANAAVTLLETLYRTTVNENNNTLYERDETWAGLKDTGTRLYRSRMAVAQIQELLDAEIMKAQDAVSDAKNKYHEEVRKASKYGDFNFEGWRKDKEDSDFDVLMISRLRINETGVAFNGSAGSASPADLELYFQRPENGDLSTYEEHLANWLTQYNNATFQDWVMALSWEHLKEGGYLSYSEYLEKYPLKIIEDENQNGKFQRLQTDYEKKQEYLGFLEGLVKSTVLEDYGGKNPNDDEDRAIGQVKIERYINKLKAGYDRVGSSGNYDFFKLSVLLDAINPGPGNEIAQAFHSKSVAIFYQEAREKCSDRQSSFFRGLFKWKQWRNAKERADTHRDKANDIVTELTKGLSNLQTRQESAKKILSDKEALLEQLNGGESTTTDTESLITAILAAGTPRAIQDILTTAATETTGSDRDRLRTLLTAGGALASLEADDTLLLLGKIALEYNNSLTASERELDAYLNNMDPEGTRNGIAVQQAIREQEYAAAWRAYMEGGLMPPASVALDEWETRIAAFGTDIQENVAGIQGLVRTYLGTQDENSDNTVLKLQKALNQWRDAAQEDKAKTALALQNAFIALADAYRRGSDCLAAMERTLITPVYNRRDDYLLTHDTHQNLYTDLAGQTSGLGATLTSQVLSRLGESQRQMNADRLTNMRKVKVNQWDLLQDEMRKEQTGFHRQMNAILSRGLLEWTKAERRLKAKSEEWASDFQESFTEKQDEWNQNYLGFLETKEEWVRELTAQAVNIGNGQILNGITGLTEDSIAKATDFLIGDVLEKPDTGTLMKDLLDETLLSGLLSGAKTLTDGIGSFTPVIFQTLKRDSFTTGDMFDRIREYQTEEDEELQARLAYIQYDQALEALKEAGKKVEETIENANESSWYQFRNMMVWDGFRAEGKNFVKKTVVGATMWETLYDTHVIEGYRYFHTEVTDFTKEFVKPEDLDLEELGFHGIQAVLGQAMEAVPLEYERIFGKTNDNGEYEKGDATFIRQYMREEEYDKVITSYDNEGNKTERIVKKIRMVPSSETLTKDQYYAYLKELEELTEDERNKKGNEERAILGDNGLFNVHMGNAPVMKPDADPGVKLSQWQKNVRFEGSGESGRIMGLYIQHKMIEAAGLAERNQPFYNKKLWDDRGSWMPAPNLRTLTDIAVTVAVAVGSGGTGLPALMAAAALNLADDAVFTMMDVANGMDAGQAFSALGKKALVSAATAVIGAGFNGTLQAVEKAGTTTTVMKGGLTDLLGVRDSVIGSTLLKGTEILTTNIATSAINAMDFTKIGTGDFFNKKAFNEGAFGTQAMAGVVSGMAGNLVAGGLNKAITNDSLLGFSMGHIGDVRNFTSTMGGLASTSVTYGMTGNATVNLLNTSMFGGPSVGLFELSFGRDGVHGAIGMGGTDLNFGKLASSLSGINILYQNHRINSYAESEGLEANVALRALYSYGDRTGRGTYRDILGGNTKLAVDENLEGDAKGKTVTGADGVKTIILKALGNDAVTGINAGITLQHEAYRDGEMSADQEAETLRAVKGHTEMAIRILSEGTYAGVILSNNEHLNDIKNYSQGAEAFAKYVGESYDSSADYWKLTADGGLEYDGEGYLRGVNGEYIRDKDGNRIGADGIEGGLIAIMQKAGVNLTSEQAAQMLAEAGFQHTNPDSEDPSTWMWNVTGEDGQQVNMGTVLSAAAFGEDAAYGAIAATLQTGLNNRFVDWQTSWNGATDAQRAYFNGYSENSYQELFAYYNANDEVWAEGSPMAWFTNNTSQVTIGGRTFATHNDSIPKFEQLAQILTDEQFTDLMAGSVGSLNGRFVRGSTEYLSDHAFGQAIDFYPDSNPFIINGNTSRETAAFNLMTAAANGTTTSIQDFDTFMAANRRLQAINNMGGIENFLETFSESQQTMNALGQLVNAGGPLDNWLINAYNSARQYNTDYAGVNSLFNSLDIQNNPNDYNEYLQYSTWIDDGIVNLQPTYINALRQSGFDWGALYQNRIDGMHFYY